MLLLFPSAGHAAFPGLNGKLAFSSNRTGEGAIWVANADGSATKIIDRFGADDVEPAWGPDGSLLTFSSPQGNEDLFVAFADGSHLRNLFPVSGELDNRRDPTWSPDGSRIAFYEEHSSLIHIIKADGLGEHAVVEGSDPSWSPDGTKIAYYHTNAVGDLDIWTIDLTTGAVTDVTNRPGVDRYPDWSPDGTKIAFSCNPSGGGPTRMCLVDADGGVPAPIGPGMDSSDLRPAWSPDGTRIAFARLVAAGNYDIYTMRADGTDVQQVTNDPGSDVTPTWQPLPPRVSGFYAKPRGATPVLVPLVPAYEQCLSPNRGHGAPLENGSCAPPVSVSDYATLGTPDASGDPAQAVGSVRLNAVAGPAGPPDTADLRVTADMTDVRCPSSFGGPTCGAANGASRRDYAGELQLLLPIRITDGRNDAPYPLGPWPATVQDRSFSVSVPCAGTPETIGSRCTVTTTIDTLVPGAITEGARTIWGLGQIAVNDGGQDGDADTTGDNQLFQVQGLFVP